MGDFGYPLIELSKLTGVDARTIRHYISIGLLPPPQTMGRGAKYGEIHLERLKAIKVLRRNNMKLDEIRDELSRIDRDRMDELLEEWSLEDPSSASGYLDQIEDEFRGKSNYVQQDFLMKNLQPPPAVHAGYPKHGIKQSGPESAPIDRLIHRLNEISGTPPKKTRRGEIWRVIEILPGVELHVRNPSHSLLSRLQRVCDYIRHILTGGDYD